MDASLRFWHDGLGLAVLMDMPFEGDWPTLFDAPSTTLRSVFLGDPQSQDSGIIELVAFENGPTERCDPSRSEHSAVDDPNERTVPGPGFLLVSLACDLDEVLPRLATLGVARTPRIVEVAGVRLAVVLDPDGVMVELMDQKATANLETISRREPVRAEKGAAK